MLRMNCSQSAWHATQCCVVPEPYIELPSAKRMCGAQSFEQGFYSAVLIILTVVGTFLICLGFTITFRLL